mmetsp:Transcript_80330/g.202115  ORF Transcript_80330/g.202115 Transcript_80330/m.202115 type:complete len:203 (-) Transcript_80330:61-669(-)
MRLLCSLNLQARSRGRAKNKSSGAQSPPNFLVRSPMTCAAMPAVALSLWYQFPSTPVATLRYVIRPKAVPATKNWPTTRRPALTITVSTFSPVSAPLSTSTTRATAEGADSTPIRKSVLRWTFLQARASPGVHVGGSASLAGNLGSASKTLQSRRTRPPKFRCCSAEIGTASSASRDQSTSTRPCSCNLWHCLLSSARVRSM